MVASCLRTTGKCPRSAIAGIRVDPHHRQELVPSSTYLHRRPGRVYIHITTLMMVMMMMVGGGGGGGVNTSPPAAALE